MECCAKLVLPRSNSPEENTSAKLPNNSASFARSSSGTSMSTRSTISPISSFLLPVDLKPSSDAPSTRSTDSTSDSTVPIGTLTEFRVIFSTRTGIPHVCCGSRALDTRNPSGRSLATVIQQLPFSSFGVPWNKMFPGTTHSDPGGTVTDSASTTRLTHDALLLETKLCASPSNSTSSVWKFHTA